MSPRHEPIYLDGFATLPLAPEARQAMMAVWDHPGNAGSPNAAGERAARIVADGRAAVAELIGAAPSEIIFTSGATEANNLALLGAGDHSSDRRRRVLVSAVEHKAVLESAHRLKARGLIVEVVPARSNGRVDLEAFRSLLGEDVLMASIMLINNETGIIQPVAEISELTRTVGALLHCDAAQGVGKIPVDVIDLDVDYLSLSGHKCYGPMGIGALYVSATAPRLAPMMFGGGQQGNTRPGTEPVPLIAGFGAAAKVASRRLLDDQLHGTRVLASFLNELRVHQFRFAEIGEGSDRVPGGVALALEGIDADMLCAVAAQEVSLSTGSACTSGQLRTSHVLEAIGFSEVAARSVIRVFCNRYTSDAEAITAARLIVACAQRCSLATGELRQ